MEEGDGDGVGVGGEERGEVDGECVACVVCDVGFEMGKGVDVLFFLAPVRPSV